MAVSEASGVDPVALSPLYDVVEPDALDALVAHARQTETPAGHRLGFIYEGYDVLVRGDGFVVLETLPDGTTDRRRRLSTQSEPSVDSQPYSAPALVRL